jgi:hypothetical protein
VTKSQERSLALVKRHLVEHIKHDVEKYGATVTNEKTYEVTKGVFFYRAETEYLGLPETNVLRFFSHDYWMFRIGPRGAVEMLQGPKSYDQFKGKGKTAFGFAVSSL